jgi:ATP-binding cassette subfamily B protein
VREVSASRRHMVILIAHRLSTVAHADVIRVLEKGRVVEEGTHDSLLDRRGLYYAMWRQQIGERDPPRPVKVEASPGRVALAEPDAVGSLVED